MPNINSTKHIDPAVYEAALNDFLTALGVDPETAFAADVQPHQTKVKHVEYTIKDNGVHSGEFWEDVISRRPVRDEPDADGND